MSFPSDLEIARAAELSPMGSVAQRLGLAPDDVLPYGRHKAKLPLELLEGRSSDGELVLVTGMSPTPAGEGKSTTAVGLADALTLRGRRAVLCLREPSLGPVFGLKGGAAGGGHAQVVPMEDINLHFTGDLHAIGAAHALLSAILDNRLHFGDPPAIDPRRVLWPRAIDMNDRALRRVVVGLGGRTGGMPREDRFVITAASEVMAALCLATDLQDLTERLGRMVVAYDRGGAPVRAGDLEVAGAMTLLLREALAPNLVQTLAGVPALVHGGPFANIAHGCNSLVATRAALALGEVAVTEAGFGTELGAEKFLHIKCRTGGLQPGAAVLVATVRALRRHGAGSGDAGDGADPGAVERGLENLAGHLEVLHRFGVPAVVALNRFATDTKEELATALEGCRRLGVPAAVADPHGQGGEGVLEVADLVLDALGEGDASWRPLYPEDAPLTDKVEAVARQVYGADGVDYVGAAAGQLRDAEALGLRNAPVCIAKTQYSFSDDPTRLGRPRGFRITVREVTPAAGAGFAVVHTGQVMTMPGLPRTPASSGMAVRPDGTAEGLF